MRIGVLTGGGDCPGLNAVIRAVVRKGAGVYGHEFVGFRDGWRGPLENITMPLGIPDVRGILPRGGTILGSSRTNPFKVDGGVERITENLHRLGIDALIAIGGEDTLGVATKLAERGVHVVGVPKTIDNDLERHRLHLRLRHRGQHRDGGDRPAAHHGRVAPPRADRRGHGPARRLDRAARRHGRRRERHPHPGAARSRSSGCAPTSRAASRRTTRRSSWWPRARCRPTAARRVLDKGLDAFGHARLGGIGEWLADEIEKTHRQGGAHHRARPHPARRHADRVRPDARHPVRAACHRRGERERLGHDGRAARHRHRPGAAGRRDHRAEARQPELYAEAEVFFG